MLCHAIYVKGTVLLATSIFYLVEFKFILGSVCLILGDQLSISCVKYMEVVNMTVLFCYLVTIFLALFCYNLLFLIVKFLVLKAKI